LGTAEGKKEGGKKEKIYMLFADLKAAFDNVDRELPWKKMRSKGIKQLLERIEKIYEDTEVMVRTRQGYTEGFKTRKGVRQGCVMSPILFNVYLEKIGNKIKAKGL